MILDTESREDHAQMQRLILAPVVLTGGTKTKRKNLIKILSLNI